MLCLKHLKFVHLSVVSPQAIQAGVYKWRLPHSKLEEPISLAGKLLKLHSTTLTENLNSLQYFAAFTLIRG